jgi:hypothetical protein
MKKIQTRLATILTVFTLAFGAAVMTAPLTYAATCTDSDGQTVETSVLDCPSGKDGRAIIWQLLEMAVNFLAAGVGIVVIAGIVFGAITYATAAGSADQAKKGITFVTNAVIGLLLFIFMYAIINFLIPGGLF